MFCAKCGSRMEDGTKFCPNCGAAVNKIKVNTLETESGESQEKRKRGIIVAFVIVLVALFVGLVVWFGGRNNKSKNNSEVTETQEIENKQTATADTEDVENTEEEKETVVKTEEYYKGTELYARYEYDTYGHLVYEEYGGRSYIYEYEYSNEKPMDVKKTEYDQNGSIVEELYTTFNYTNEGNLIEEIRIGGEYDVYIYYEYDDAGNLKIRHWSNYDAESGELGTEEYSYYAKDGMLIESRVYTSTYEVHVTYNKQGEIISSKFYDTDGSYSEDKYEYEYEYDEYGNITEWYRKWYRNSQYSYSELWRSYEYVYDENGNILEQYEYDENGTLGDNYRYTYY